jgi:ketosteroid isomerase-like protein
VTEQGDSEAAARLWVTDDDAVLFGSEKADAARGFAAIQQHLRSITSSQTTIRFTWRERHAHAEGDVAWINASGTLAVAGRKSDYQITAVLVFRDGRWLWHTFNGSEPND